MYLPASANFLPQTYDLHVDGPIRNSIVVAVNAVEYLLAAEHPTRPAGQELQHPKFRGTQIHQSALHPNLMAARMNHQVVDLDHLVAILVVWLGRRARRATQHGPVSGQATLWG